MPQRPGRLAQKQRAGHCWFCQAAGIFGFEAALGESGENDAAGQIGHGCKIVGLQGVWGKSTLSQRRCVARSQSKAVMVFAYTKGPSYF